VRISSLKAGVAILAGTHALGNNHSILRQQKIRMKLRPRTVLDAVRRPYTAACIEMARPLRMPVAGGDDEQKVRLEPFDIAIERGNDTVPIRHRERTAWAKIILHIHDQKRISRLHRILL